MSARFIRQMRQLGWSLGVDPTVSLANDTNTECYRLFALAPMGDPGGLVVTLLSGENGFVDIGPISRGDRALPSEWRKILGKNTNHPARQRALEELCRLDVWSISGMSESDDRDGFLFFHVAARHNMEHAIHLATKANRVHKAIVNTYADNLLGGLFRQV